MKKYYLWLILLSNSIAFSQNQKQTFYLKDGSTIQGYAKKDKDKIRVDINKQSFIFLDSALIDSICGNSVRKKSGNFTYSYALGYLGEFNDLNSKIELQIGYQIKEYINLKVGTGLELLRFAYFPAIIELQYVPFHKSSSPFIYFSGGGIFPLKRSPDVDLSLNNGSKFSFGLGATTPKTDYGFGFYFSMGYSHYQFKEISFQSWNDTEVFTHYYLNRLEFRIGVVFY